MSDTTDYISSTPCAAPALRTNIATAGLLTACNASIPAPADVAALYKNNDDFRLMSVPFMYQWEAKACRAKQNNMFDFLMTQGVNLSKSVAKENLPDGLLDIRPFVKVKRKGPINNSYWAANNGLACDADGTTNASGAYWKMDMSSPTGIPLHADWFLPPEWIFVKSVTNAGVQINWAGSIVKRTLVSGDTKVTVVMKPQMNQSNLPAANKANPTEGIATRGVGNITKFESFCLQPPGLIQGQLDPYWLGWTRNSFKTDSSYEKWLKLVLADNMLYKEIFHLSIADYNKQVAEDFQMKQVESFFYSTALAGQTESTYNLDPNAGGLELITTGEDSPGGTRCIGRRAQPIGVLEQHVQCNRLFDAQGAKLNLPALFQALYKMMRIRKASGSPGPSQRTFEIAMPQNYFTVWHQGMLEVYDSAWRGKVKLSLDITPQAKVAPMGFLYYEYPLVFPVGCTIRVIIDDFFDDYASMANDFANANTLPNYANVGRRLWIIDWSQIHMGIADSKVVSANPGTNMQLAQTLGVFDPCKMETISEQYTHRAWFWTAICQCTAGNLIIENVSGELPEHDAIGTTNYDNGLT